MNLFLALFWLVCAAMLLVYEQFLGVTRFRIRVGEIHISYVWLMLVLALYNLLRWWSSRSAKATQRALEQARTRQEWRRRIRPTEPAQPPDPNFNFTDEPSPPDHRSVTDQPQPPE
jgi:hypothetical protein